MRDALWGNALARRGELNVAIAHYREAVEIKPQHVDAHYNLSRALARRGKLDQAIAEYETVLQLDLGFTPARRLLQQLIDQRQRLETR
jgi:tetratricopeptide (TPR) repeat protein